MKNDERIFLQSLANVREALTSGEYKSDHRPGPRRVLRHDDIQPTTHWTAAEWQLILERKRKLTAEGMAWFMTGPASIDALLSEGLICGHDPREERRRRARPMPHTFEDTTVVLIEPSLASLGGK